MNLLVNKVTRENRMLVLHLVMRHGRDGEKVGWVGNSQC